MSIKKYWKFDVRSDSDIVRALRYAAKFGAVTNNGFPYDSSLISMKGLAILFSNDNCLIL